MKRPEKGVGLFYTRDSGGNHEMTPAQYVEWAQRQAAVLGVDFRGTVAQLNDILVDGLHCCGDLFVDMDVKGNVLSRRGLDAMINRALNDRAVTHIFIARRDRLARPDNPVDGIKLEERLRRAGLTLVFMDRMYAPLSVKARADIGDQITAFIDYDSSGRFRYDLAQKIIYAQIALAKEGYSVGGRARFGFDRWLVHKNGATVRKLMDGERVRIADHHVVWLPAPEDDPRMQVIRRILSLLENHPACRVAQILNADGIPSPDAGRKRTENGIKHYVSGLWHQPTILNIARNSLLLAITSHGRRSMGDQLRFSPQGPRELTDADMRADGKPKVVRNDDSVCVTAQATFAPLVDPERHDKLIAELDARAGKQRGKPRSRDPKMNPLGSRIFDMACGWPMYRTPRGDGFQYACGLYAQSHSAKCDSNHIDGVMATKFGIAFLRQRFIQRSLADKVRERVLAIAHEELGHAKPRASDKGIDAALRSVDDKIARVASNMALADTPAQLKAMQNVFEGLQAERETLIATSKSSPDIDVIDMDDEVEKAMADFEKLPALISDADELGAIGDAFHAVDLRLFCRFETTQPKKRKVQRLVGGIVTIGAAAPPVEIYGGRTDRASVKSNEITAAGSVPACSGAPIGGQTGLEDKSTGNVNRGEQI